MLRAQKNLHVRATKKGKKTKGNNTTIMIVLYYIA
jgi:hypothetical protein